MGRDVLLAAARVIAVNGGARISFREGRNFELLSNILHLLGNRVPVTRVVASGAGIGSLVLRSCGVVFFFFFFFFFFF